MITMISKHILFTIIAILSINAMFQSTRLVLASSATDLYIDNQATTSSYDGTKENPYLQISDAFDTISSSNPANLSDIVLNIAPSQISYLCNELHLTLDGKSKLKFSITTWNNTFSPRTPQDSAARSILNVANSSVVLESFNLLEISQVDLIGINSSISLNNTSLSLDSLNISTVMTPVESFIIMRNSVNATLNNVEVSIENYGSILQYIDGIGAVNLQSIITNINVKSDAQDTYYTGDSVFQLTSQKDINNTQIIVRDFDIRMIEGGKTLQMPSLFRSDYFQNTSLEGISFNNQNFSSREFSSLFFIKRSNYVSIQGLSFLQNTMVFRLPSPLLTIQGPSVINIKDLDFSSNEITSIDEGVFSLIDFRFTPNVSVTNQALNSNIFNGPASIYTHLSSEDDTEIDFVLSNITITNNTNLLSTNQFSFTEFESSQINSVDVSDVTFSNNQLSGRLFSFQARPPSALAGFSEYVPPKNISFSRINVTQNQNISDFSFMYFLPFDDIPNKYSCLQPIELYAVSIDGLSVTNNNLKRGSNNFWATEVDLFQLKQTQLFMGNSIISGNSLEHYNLFNLDEKPSTIIVTSTQVINNNFTFSQFLKTSYFMSTFPYAYAGSDILSSANPIYRLSFVLDSTFSGLNFWTSTLFTLNNGFFIMQNNTFEEISIIDSDFITTTFEPTKRPSGMNAYTREPLLEAIMLQNSPRVRDLFNENIAKASASEEDNLFFYIMSNNSFSDISSNSSRLVYLKGYGFNQSFISISANHFTNLTLNDTVKTTLVYCDGLTAMTITNNTYQYLKGNPRIFSLSQTSQALDPYNRVTTLQVLSNSMEDSKAKSFIKLIATSVVNFLYKDNFLKNIGFTAGWIYADVKEIYDNWVFDNNTLNTVDLVMDLNFSKDDRFGFLFLYNERIFTNDSQIILKNNLLKGITLQIFSKSNLYTQISLLVFQTRQSLYLKNTTIQNVSISSFGNLIDTVNVPMLNISDSLVKDIHVNGFDGVIKLSALDTQVYNTTFYNIKNLAGPGVFFLAAFEPAYTIGINQSLFDQLYSSASGSLLTVRLLGASELRENVRYDHDLDEVKDCNLTLDFYNSTVQNVTKGHMFDISGVKCNSCDLMSSALYVAEKYKKPAVWLHDGVSGQVRIVETKLSQEHTYLPSFIEVHSCTAEVIIERLKHSAHKKPFSLIKLDSGNITVKDSLIENVQLDGQSIIETNLVVSGTDQFVGLAYLNIQNTTFQNIDTKVPILRDNTNFLRIFSTDPGSESIVIPIILLEIPTTFNVKNCTFDNISSAPAILMSSNTSNEMIAYYRTEITVEDTTFRNLQFVVGPAITTMPRGLSALLSINNTNFENNGAEFAGAIALHKTSLNITNTIFRNNSATFTGATILFGDETTNNAPKLTNVSFYNNTSETGQDIAFEAITFKMEFVSDEPSGIITSYNSPVDNSSGTFLLNVSANELRNGYLRLDFVDIDGDSAVELSVKKEASFGTTIDGLFTKFAAVIAWDTRFACNISLNNVLLEGNAGDIIQLQLQYTSTRSMEFRDIFIYLRPCLPGEFNNTASCEPCAENTYSLSVGKTCSPCPTNAICPLKSQICPSVGYWSPPDSPQLVQPCRIDDIERCDHTQGCNSCSTGYIGPLCNACDYSTGYIENGYLRCGQCEDPEKSLVYSIVYLVIYFLFQVFSINAIYNGNQVTRVKQTNYLIIREAERCFYIKCLLTYSQLMSTLYIDNSEMYKNLGLASQAGNPSSLIVYGTQCSMIALGIDYNKYLYYETFMIVVSPVVQFLALLFILLTIGVIKRTRKPFKLLGVAILYLVISSQPGIIAALGQFLSCSEIDGYAPTFIRSHPFWTCTSPEYNFYAWFLAIPGLILYCAVIPLVILIVLFINKKKLKTEFVETSFGVLLFDVNDKFYFWGIVLMVLKIVLSFMVFGLEQKLQVQIFASLVFLWIYQSLVKYFRPYKSLKFNNFEVMMMNLLMFNIIAAQYLINPANGSLVNTISVVASVIANGSFVIFIMWKILSLTYLTILSMIERSVMKRTTSRTEGFLKQASLEANDSIRMEY